MTKSFLFFCKKLKFSKYSPGKKNKLCYDFEVLLRQRLASDLTIRYSLESFLCCNWLKRTYLKQLDKWNQFYGFRRQKGLFFWKSLKVSWAKLLMDIHRIKNASSIASATTVKNYRVRILDPQAKFHLEVWKISKMSLQVLLFPKESIQTYLNKETKN